MLRLSEHPPMLHPSGPSELDYRFTHDLQLIAESLRVLRLGVHIGLPTST